MADSDMTGPVLGVGLACLDVILLTSSYPAEDSDQRALDRYSNRGGNASNVCTVLAELGDEEVEFLGTLADDLESETMIRDFKANNITIDHCPRHSGCQSPLSTVIVNSKNASRTILHTNKNLPELSLEEFRCANPSQFKWIHFEARNLDAVVQMMALARSLAPRAIISVDVEKVGRNHESLLPLVDVAFVSRDISESHGATDAEAAAIMFRSRLSRPGAKLFATWGSKGAAAVEFDTGAVFLSDAFRPVEGVVDSLGAGDTFAAAAIFALRRRMSTQATLTFACKVAGAKVGRRGFKGLKLVA